MNIKNKEIEESIIYFFTKEKLTKNEIYRRTGISVTTITNILKRNNIDDRYVYAKEKHYIEIENFLKNSNFDIKTALKKFKLYKKIVYSILEKNDIKITDQLILDIFILISKEGFAMVSKPSLKHFIIHKNENKFIYSVLQYLTNRFSDSKSFSETIVRIYRKIETRPVCKECGAELKYLDICQPFQVFCSKKCANNNVETKYRLKLTCLKKYGVTNTAKAEITKQHYREHTERKYGKGIINSWQAKEVIEKLEKTKLEKYSSSKYNNREKAEKHV